MYSLLSSLWFVVLTNEWNENIAGYKSSGRKTAQLWIQNKSLIVGVARLFGLRQRHRQIEPRLLHSPASSQAARPR